MNISALARITHKVGGERRVRPGNPFVVEYVFSDGSVASSTDPNWPVIIPVAIIALTALIVGIVLLCRHYIRTHYVPVHFAGKVKYAKPGPPIEWALISILTGNNWLKVQTDRLKGMGVHIKGLYLDADLTIPFNENAKLQTPLRIFPKIIK